VDSTLPLRVLPGGVTRVPGDDFEVGYVTEGGVQARQRLGEAWSVRFEYADAVREFKSHKGMRHLPGRWWSATMEGHVGFESWLERDHLMLLDFDPLVVGVSSQPFWLFWGGERGRWVSHAPDYFARRADGSGVVVDCRPVERIKPRDLVKFDATRRACVQVGWEYRLVGAVDAVLAANVRWLAGYRHPRHRVEPVAGQLREVFGAGGELMEGARTAGDPVAVLPVLFHLLWRHELSVDLTVPLHAGSVVESAAVAR